MDRDEERLIEADVDGVLHLYYFHTDRNELAKAANLYTLDAVWYMDDRELHGRDAILAAMDRGMTGETVRHVQSNTFVNVVDEDHAEAHWYSTIYKHTDARRDDTDSPLPFDGPGKLSDFRADLVRTPEGWRFARRGSQVVFQR